MAMDQVHLPCNAPVRSPSGLPGSSATSSSSASLFPHVDRQQSCRPAHQSTSYALLAVPGSLAALSACAVVHNRRWRKRRSCGLTSGRTGRTTVFAGAPQALPPILSSTSGKKELKKIIEWVLKHEPDDDERKQFLDGLKDTGFSWATKAGLSLGYEDLLVPPAKAGLVEGARRRMAEAEARFINGDLSVVERSRKATTEWNAVATQVKDAAMGNFRKNYPLNSVYMMSISGARGNVSQVRQLVGMRGLMADATGQLIEVPIEKCLREGMSVTDVFISANGARKGVIDTAMKTADSGYLYRRLDFAVQSVRISEHDCGSTEAQKFRLDEGSTSLEDHIRGHVLAEDCKHPETNQVIEFPDTGHKAERGHLLTKSEAAYIAFVMRDCKKRGYGESLFEVSVRTPLTCKLGADSVCAHCYGEDLSTPGKLAELGIPVGVIAAQSMGEPGTQLTMRTFHTGGAFEGSVGEGVQACRHGVVELTAAKGGKFDPREAQRKRTDIGDVDWILKEDLTLKLYTDDEKKEALQEEMLTRGDHLKVLDGDRVSLGQILFERVDMKIEDEDDDLDDSPTKEEDEEDEEAEVVFQPVVSEVKGEVVIEAGVEGREKEDKLVWVLSGQRVEVEITKETQLLVRSGDLVSEGAVVAAKLADSAAMSGVPRFLSFRKLTRGMRLNPPSLPEDLQGWRSDDWTKTEEVAAAGPSGGSVTIDDPLAEHEPMDEDQEGTADLPSDEDQEVTADPEALDNPVGEILVSRTDFDWFKTSGSGRLAKYKVSFEAPKELLMELPKPTKEQELRKATRAPKRMRQAIPPAEAFVHVVDEEGDRTVAAACAHPSTSSTAVLNVASRITHKEHVVPFGGAIFRTFEGKRKDEQENIFWCPEETHKVDVTLKELEYLLQHQHGRHVEKKESVETSDQSFRRELFLAGVAGILCFYSPTAALQLGVAEGTRRFHITEDMCSAAKAEHPRLDTTEVIVSIVCSVKPGLLVSVPSNVAGVADTSLWWDEPAPDQMINGEEASRGALSGDPIKRQFVPPSSELVPGWDAPENMTHRSWRVVEMLEARSTDEEESSTDAKILIRPVKRIGVPLDSLAESTGKSKVESFWHCPYADGEILEQQQPIALVHEIQCSVGRHAEEPHTVTFAQPAAEGMAVPSKPFSEKASPNVTLESDAEWSKEKMRFVQHSPLKAVRSKVQTWKEPPLRYISESECVHQRENGGIPCRVASTDKRGWVIRTGNPTKGPATVSFLAEADCKVLEISTTTTKQVGDLVRQGEKLSDADDSKSPFPGQILAVEKHGLDGCRILMRQGHPYLCKGEVRVSNGSAVQIGDKLGFEAMASQKTSDIVQGLPKVMAIFEATKKSGIKEMAHKMWAKEDYTTDVEKVRMIQMRVAQEIADMAQSTYQDQGVGINGRHIELVARRMTQKVRIVNGGKWFEQQALVDLRDVETVQALNTSAKLQIEPHVHGITKIGMLDNHILVSMGFREADSALVQHIYSEEIRSPLEGIKENIMVGKKISAGSNFRRPDEGKGRCDEDRREPRSNFRVEVPEDIWG